MANYPPEINLIYRYERLSGNDILVSILYCFVSDSYVKGAKETLTSRRRRYVREIVTQKPGVAAGFLSNPCNQYIKMKLRTCSF